MVVATGVVVDPPDELEIRCTTCMSGVEVSGREPTSSSGPAPTFTMTAVYRRSRCPGIVVVSIVIVLSFAMPRAGRRLEAAAPGAAAASHVAAIAAAPIHRLILVLPVRPARPAGPATILQHGPRVEGPSLLVCSRRTPSCGCDQLSVEGLELRHHPLGGEAGGPSPASLAHPPPRGRVVDHPPHRRRQRGNVTRRHQQPILPVGDHVVMAPRRGSDHGPALALSLVNDVPEGLEPDGRGD